jgi:hypothetical protein
VRDKMGITYKFNQETNQWDILSVNDEDNGDCYINCPYIPTYIPLKKEPEGLIKIFREIINGK